MPRFDRHLLLVLGALASTSGRAEAEPTSTAVYRLSQLVDMAVARSPMLRASDHKIRAARAQLTESKVSPFSQFSITGGITAVPTVQGTPLFSDSSNQLGLEGQETRWTAAMSAELEGTVPVYTGGKIRGAWEAAEQGVDAAARERGRVESQVRFEVRRAYFALQFALDVLALIDEGKGKLVNAVKRLEERIESGDPEVDETDRYRLSSTLAEIEARQAEAVHLEKASRAALAALSGLDDVNVPECPLEATAYELEAPVYYTKRAREGRAELRMLDNAVRAKKAAVGVATAQYYPDVGINLRVGRTYTPGRTDQRNPFAADGANTGSLGAVLGAKWSLDFWGTHFRVERAEAELDQTKAQRDAASMGIAIEVANVVETVRDSQRQEAAWATGERDSRAWFLAAVQAYQLGTNESRDLVDAIKAYFNARGRHLESLRALNTAIADLERSLGQAILASASAWEAGCTEE